MNPSPDLTVHSKATFRVAFFFGLPLQALLLALALLLPAQRVWAEAWRVGVEAVVDGDTLVLRGGERLRLRGIDAPEILHKDKPGQYYGTESKKVLSSLVAGQDLFLDKTELDTDRYGRLVGLARLGDGRVLNLAMIEEGAAFVYPHASDKDSGMARRFFAAQVSAIGRGNGFWPRVLGSPEASTGFVGTRSSRRFHTLSCPLGHEIKAHNRVTFSSLRDAFTAGYAPARECTSWPLVKGR